MKDKIEDAKIEENARYVEGKIIVTDETKESDRGIPEDKRMFDFIKTVGNSIHPSIQLEIDVPSNHTDGKLPILDLKVWIGKVEIDGNTERKIIHELYTKEIASNFLIEEKSAMSIQQKRPILTQMCLRVLLNNSKYLSHDLRKEKVEYFMRRMQASGYCKKFRYEILKSAISVYKKIENDPIRPLNRNKEWTSPKRRSELKRKRKTWFRKDGHESVLLVKATPSSTE